MNNLLKTNPRFASLSIINEYLLKKTDLKNLLNSYLEKNHMPDIDRRFLFEIVKGTIRFLLKIDYLIGIFSDIKIDKIDFEILNLLREASYQLLYMDRVPAYSIVDESVKISKKISGKSVSGYINAVLRKMSGVKNLKDFLESSIAKTSAKNNERISLMHSFPLWLVDYWTKMFGEETTETICKNLNREPVVTLVVNSSKISKKGLLKILAEDFNRSGKNIISMDKTGTEEQLFENCIFIKNSQGITDLGAFQDGYFSIQDFSSQIPVKYFLKPKKKEKILDLCGAPGGKAAFMSQITSNGCEIISVDISDNKLALFEENIRRLGLKNITLVSADATKNGYLSSIKDQESFINHFDKIFIDAPCSSFGTISKNPDVKYNRDHNDLYRLGDKSLKILSNCTRYLKPGGIIVFYTCTLSSIENQDMIRNFIKSNSISFKIKKILLPPVIRDHLEVRKTGTLKQSTDFFEVMPYFFNSEAGFIAITEKKI